MSRDACLFCEPDPELVFYRGARVVGLWESIPSMGRALLAARRHVASWLEATPEEREELFAALARVHEASHARGYHIDVRETPHLHVQMVPKAAAPPDRVLDRPLSTSFVPGLVTGENDPLLPYLRRHLDEAEGVDLLASFILESGVILLEGHLEDLLDRGGRVRILTGDYLHITEPDALLRLLDLREGTKGTLDARIFVSGDTSFHPKAYLFYGPSPIAYIGSSNLSGSALTQGHRVELPGRLPRRIRLHRPELRAPVPRSKDPPP
jgi:diadenosine tetraphosphate (Ap4A) HIT family hydrolase